jgi:D-3-phosphoglycerate dehydrogenase
MPTQFRIRTINSISSRGLDRLPGDRYDVSPDANEPDAIIVRSAELHDTPIADTVKAIGRAGAGTNNVPVAAMSKRGVPVFNAPGANANAVKSSSSPACFLGAQHLPGVGLRARVECRRPRARGSRREGKKKFVGHELPGRVLGVVGLGAIGVEVANAAHALVCVSSDSTRS